MECCGVRGLNLSPTAFGRHEGQLFQKSASQSDVLPMSSSPDHLVFATIPSADIGLLGVEGIEPPASVHVESHYLFPY
jgi:hypothetical protein